MESVKPKSTIHEAEGYKCKPTTFKEDVVIVLAEATLLSLGTYIAWRLDNYYPIQGQVKQLAPNQILSN